MGVVCEGTSVWWEPAQLLQSGVLGGTRALLGSPLDLTPLIFIQAHRHEVTICNYEASANPADHKLEQITPQTHFIS